MEIYTIDSLRSQCLSRDVAQIGSSLQVVMRGLDPRIHHSSLKSEMDRRVKPGDDSCGVGLRRRVARAKPRRRITPPGRRQS